MSNVKVIKVTLKPVFVDRSRREYLVKSICGAITIRDYERNVIHCGDRISSGTAERLEPADVFDKLEVQVVS